MHTLKEDEPAQSPETDPHYFVAVAALSRRFSKAAYNATGISLTDFRVLSHFAAHEGADQRAPASKALGISRSAASTSMTALAEKGFVSQQQGSRKAARITLAGREAFFSTRAALSRCALQATPRLLSSEQTTIEHYMVLFADRLGASIMFNGKVDPLLALVEVNARVKRLMKDCFSRQGLTIGEFLVLGGAGAQASGTQPAELANSLHMNKPDITNASQSLVKKGYLDETPVGSDGRRKLLHATSVGREVLRACCGSFWNEFHARVRELDAEEFAFFRNVNARA